MSNLTINISGTTCTVLVDGKPPEGDDKSHAAAALAHHLPAHLPVLVATQEPASDGVDVWHLHRPPHTGEAPRRLVLAAPIATVLSTADAA
jgi:hypothetical protein